MNPVRNNALSKPSFNRESIVTSIAQDMILCPRVGHHSADT